MGESQLFQSSFRRVVADTIHTPRRNPWFFWSIGIVMVALGGFLGTVYTPEGSGRFISAICLTAGVILGAIIGIIIIFIINLILAPYRQRNEARVRVIELEAQLEIQDFFEVEPRKEATHLPISRLKDGTYESVGAIGPAPIKLIHVGELTKIHRIAAIPEVRCINPDNSGWGTHSWITAEPIEVQIGSVASMDFTWDTNNQRRWELTGLPLDVNRREELTLPYIQIRVSDANEVMAHFAKGGRCVLAISLSIRTDKGSQQIDQEIELVVDHLADTLEKKEKES